MKKRLISLCLVLLLIMHLGYLSAKTTQISSQENGLDINYQKTFYLKQAEDTTLRIIVINASNGVQLTNATTECFLYLTDNYGAYISKKEMNYSDSYFLAVLDGSNLSKVGYYTYGYYCNSSNLGAFVSIEAEVTGTGYEFSQTRVLLYMALLGILIFLFVVNIGVIPMLPSGNNYDDEGRLISINDAKYIRSILFATAYLLLMATTFIGSNVALAYMGTTLIGDLLYKIWYIMMALSLPMVVIWFIFLFHNMFEDKRMKRYLERGWE